MLLILKSRGVSDIVLGVSESVLFVLDSVLGVSDSVVDIEIKNTKWHIEA